MFFNFPEILVFISITAFGLLLKGLVLDNVGTKSKTSLKPNLLFFKLVLITNSPKFSFNEAIDGYATTILSLINV